MQSSADGAGLLVLQDVAGRMALPDLISNMHMELQYP